MRVAIAGATGLTGNLCLQMLLANSAVTRVIAIGRKGTGLNHRKLEELRIEENQLKMPVLADAFICCLGTTIKDAGSKEAFQCVDRDLVLHISRNLYQNGCQVASVISAMGADPNSSFFYNKVKGQMEVAMKAMGFVSLAIIRPSFISGVRSKGRRGEQLVQLLLRLLGPLLIGPLRHYKAVSAKNVARSLVFSVIQPSGGIMTILSNDLNQF